MENLEETLGFFKSPEAYNEVFALCLTIARLYFVLVLTANLFLMFLPFAVADAQKRVFIILEVLGLSRAIRLARFVLKAVELFSFISQDSVIVDLFRLFRQCLCKH